MKTKYIKSFLLFLLLGCCISVSAQNIQGVVTDSLTNEPIPYLSVFYEGKGVGSITDNDGNYKVETRKGWNKLTFSVYPLQGAIPVDDVHDSAGSSPRTVERVRKELPEVTAAYAELQTDKLADMALIGTLERRGVNRPGIEGDAVNENNT